MHISQSKVLPFWLLFCFVLNSIITIDEKEDYMENENTKKICDEKLERTTDGIILGNVKTNIGVMYTLNYNNTSKHSLE